MKKAKDTPSSLLRQKAEELLRDRKISTAFSHPHQLSEDDLLKLIHNLEVHQVELEMQNEELLLAKAAEKQITESYVELYDFAPSAYFTLSQEAKIIKLNLKASQLLGKDRQSLINSSFAFFVTDDEKPKFAAFLDEVIEDTKTAYCELSLTANGHPPFFVQLVGTLNENKNQFLITAVDLSEHYAYLQAEQQKAKVQFARLHLLEFAEEHTLNELLEETLNQLEILTGSLIGFSHFVEDDQQTLRLQNWSSRTKKEFCRAEAIDMEYKVDKAGIWVDCIRQRKTIIHNDYASLTVKKGLPPGHAEVIREMVVPVIRKGKIKAIMGVGNKPTDYQSKDIEMVSALADLVWDICERKMAEEALQISKWRMESIIQASFIGTWQWNVQTGETIFNELWAEIIGYTLDELAPISIKTWEALVHPDDLKQSAMLLEQHFTGELPYYDCECRIKHKNGQWVWVRDRGSVISFTGDGKPLMMYGTHTDITQRKQSEEALKESYEIFSLFMKYSPIYSFIKEVKPDESRVLRASENFKEMIGIAGEEMRGKTMYELFPPELAAKMTADDWSVISNAKMLKLDEEINGRNYTTFKFPIPKEDKNLLAGYTIDITEQKSAEQDLKKAYELLASISDGSTDAIYVKDINGRYLMINKEGCNLVGKKQQEILGKDDFSLFPAEEAQIIMDGDRNVMKNSKVLTYEEIVTSTKGVICLLSTKGPIYDHQGKVSGIFGIDRDISERKQAEAEIINMNAKLLKTNTEKDKFFSIIAHDLRGPFSNFLGLTKIMAESLTTLSIDEIEKFANSMKSSATNLYRLLENLLEWAKIQQGLIPFKPKLNPLWVIIDESVEMIVEAAEKKGIKISYNFSSETEVFADSNILQTIFRNLISNAIKFTPRGGNIQISAKPNMDQNLEVSVKDSGIGMDTEMIENLFRIDIDTNRKGTDEELSTGLGLFICKDFIEKHGGNLWVESEVGVGSTFYFTLPIKN